MCLDIRMDRLLRWSVVGMLMCMLALPTVRGEDVPPRVRDGLLVLYDFSEGEAARVHDRSEAGPPLDLVIERPEAVSWVENGLRVESAAVIVSADPAGRLVDAIKRSASVTIEAWVTPASVQQSGPARIVSLSKNPSERNFTLGQEKDAYDVRLRSESTDRNGNPSTASRPGVVKQQLTHVAYTRDADGATRLFVDGEQVGAGRVAGSLANWDASHRLSVANEVTGDRPFLGTLHLVAVYDRSLSIADVQQNFAVGSAALDPPPTPAELNAIAFNETIAPLFARHCIECHDPAIRQGGLDLSRGTAALRGGDSGVVITAGNAEESLLWDSVATDAMPHERPPLSADEKAALRKWIDGGAAWPTEVIDPVIYTHSNLAGEVWVQRLTVPEYVATVKAAVGVDIAGEASELLPADLRADGFRNTAYNLGVDLKHVEALSRLAEIIVGRMDVLEFASRFSKSRSLSTDNTMRKQVASMGQWLLRGPLNENEINTYSGIATTVSSAGGDFEQAMRFIIEAMLQSPRFVYRIENHRGSGESRQVGQFELASRLSYILWGGPPDAELYAAAERNELRGQAAIEAQVSRMLKDPRAVERSLQFVDEWLDLERLTHLQPDPRRFPQWNEKLAADMREETRRFFEEIVWREGRPLADLINAPLTFATPQLAVHYGLEPAGDGFQRYELAAASGRRGILSQGSVLTIGGDDASMVSRGLFVLHDLLRGTVNAPPPCVNTTPPATKAGLTQRGIAEQRIANQQCGVCHARFEPLAFGLEKFDGIGGFHSQDEHGNPLRDDGEVLFPGEAEPVAYESSVELMDLLAASERVKESLTWKVAQFAFGRPLVAEDAAKLKEVHLVSQEGGGTYPSLMAAIVLSDLVQKTATEKAE